tara:strand:- start:37 stop:627 length:591 start_codon:yes stop_codon:yes gene_type:complete
MATSITTDATTTTLNNNGNAYLTVSASDVVSLTNPLPVASGGTGATSLALGKVVQIVNVTDGTLKSGTTVLPADDTIPQNTEGTEWMTLAITPTSATSKLLIQVVCNMGNDSTVDSALALFQDSTANALAASFIHNFNSPKIFTINHFMAAGTTSATTFKVRGGANAGTNRFNGKSTNRLYGGVASSSITITEYSA